MPRRACGRTTAGAKTYFGNAATRADVAGVMIGHPGDWVVVGGRGFLRAEVTVRGTAGHSGGSRAVGTGNAVEKAARLVQELSGLKLPEAVDGEFPLPPRLTVTAIHGGTGFTIVPDTCAVNVEVRLTPGFTALQATSLLHAAADVVDEHWLTDHATTVEFSESWPAYRLAGDSPLVAALTQAATQATGHRPVQYRQLPCGVGHRGDGWVRGRLPQPAQHRRVRPAVHDSPRAGHLPRRRPHPPRLGVRAEKPVAFVRKASHLAALRGA
ncbi:MAG: peptidase dimerization domain-containing protein [Egibacteraceae bacterium]